MMKTRNLGNTRNSDLFDTLEPRQLLSTFTVMNTSDAGAGSLRQAIVDANLLSGADTIEFDAALENSTISLTTGELPITSDLAINGKGADGSPLGITVSGTNASRIFNVNNNSASVVSVTISDLTMTGGFTASNGGAIVSAENLTIQDSIIAMSTSAMFGGAVSQSTAGTQLTILRSAIRSSTSAGGAGVHVDEASALIDRSEISANSATVSGGGLLVSGTNGTATVRNSTISGNSAPGNGGGIWIDASFTANTYTILNSTISQNRSDSDNAGGELGGGLYAVNGAIVNLQSTILDKNFSGTGATIDDIEIVGGAALDPSSSNNLIGDAVDAGGLTDGVNGNIVGQDAMLAPLAMGGRTQTHALLEGSPAIDKGSNSGGLTTDQRSGDLFARVSGAGPDIGAYERQTVSLVVDNTAVTEDFDYRAGQLTLTEALNLTNSNRGADTITFASTLSGSTITLTGTQLTITDDLTMTGLGAGNLAIDGGGLSRVLLVDDSDYSTQRTVAISDLTIQNGGLVAGNFGAGLANEDDLTLTDVVITGNSLVNGSADLGAGIYNGFLNGPGANLTLVRTTVSGNTNGFGAGIFSDGNLAIIDSTISGNTSEFSGGGIQFNGVSLSISGSTVASNSAAFQGGGIHITFGTVTISNSTISGNAAGGGFGGGGISDFGATALVISNSTIAFNVEPSGLGGGIFANAGPITLTSTIVANNSNGAGTATDIGLGAGTIGASSSNNLIGDSATNGGLTHGANSNIVGQDPLLAALANNGGLTRTHALMSGSPAIDAGAALSSLTSDQRGSVFARLFGDTPDIGAYERQTLALVVDTTEASDDGDLSAGDLSIREAIAASNANPLDDTISFDVSLGGSTITVLGSFMTISDDVTITGPGSGQLTIDGNANSRIFSVTDGTVGSTISVVITGLTLTNGSIANGGAIDNLENLSLTDVTLTGNNATNDGGAIHNTGTLTITDSTISGNTSADAGGAIDNDGATTVTITNSTISGNTAGGAAGAIDSDSGATLTITGSTISNNVTGSSGGAIDNAGTLTITDSTLSANASTDSANGLGGAIQNQAGSTLTISGSTLNGNMAAAGGAIENNAAATITNSTLDGNFAADSGGAIDNFGGTLTITGSTLSNNMAAGSGGAIWTDVSLTIQSSTISGNSAGDFGGGIGMFDGTVVIANSTIANNVADANDDSTGQGGGIDVGKRTGAGTLTTTSTIYAGNTLGTTSPAANDITLTDGTVSGTNNLVQDAATAGGLANGTNGNLVGVDPKLGALADNGGPTLTHSIYPGSPAHNAGIASGGVSTDQRGESRTQGANPDIGAYEWAPTADFSLLALAGTATQATSLANNTHISVVRNAAGDLIVFTGSSSTWTAARLNDYTSAPAVTGDPIIWTDPNDGLAYVAAPSAGGFLLFRRASNGTWTFRDLAAETANTADAPVGTLAYFVTRPKTGSPLVFVAGINAAGEIVAYQQTTAAGGTEATWTLYNISDDLTSQSMTTPAFTQMTSYVTSWNQWTLAGLDASGNVQGVWVNIATFTTWRVDNLSTITGAAPLTGVLDVTLTTWGGIRFAGASASGRLVATWWNPGLGGGNWKQTDLTAAVPNSAGPGLAGGQLTAWFTPTNLISYAGYDANGDVVSFHWQPGDGGVWSADNLTVSLPNRSSRPVGTITSHVSAAGESSVVGASAAHAVVRLWALSGSSTFTLDNLSDLAVRV